MCIRDSFRAVKRIEDVILVFNECLKKQPAKLIMVGDGPLIPMAKEKVAELGITDHVVFLGSSREIHKILSYSDIFLLPSSYESFGLSALEAMSCGVPVISSDTGGIPEVNTDGFSGFTSPVGAIKEMAENALFILKDSKTQQAFKDQAYQKALSFDADKIIPMYETLYKKTIASLKSTCAE